MSNVKQKNPVICKHLAILMFLTYFAIMLVRELKFLQGSPGPN